MREVKPAFYDKFTCIGGECDFTCCQEWKIAVDEETNKKWKDIKPPAGVATRRKNLSLFTRFKDGQRVIDLGKDHKCPFLDENRLCRIVIEHGDSVISETCQTFPREIHTFADQKEYTLMPCCPAAVDFLKEGSFALVESGDQPEADQELSNLRELRSTLMEIQEKKEYSLEEGILVNFYLTLDEYDQWAKAGEDQPYQIFRKKEDNLEFSEEVKRTIEGLDFDEEGRFHECNELFLDLIENYRKEGMYLDYLEEPAALADRISEGLENELASYQEFVPVLNQYEEIMRNYLVQEYYADFLIPDADLEGAVVKLQWIAMEYVTIRHLCFLRWNLTGTLDYKAVRDYIVMVSRMMGYEEDDIYEYMEKSFEELLWDWGYMALIVGR